MIRSAPPTRVRPERAFTLIEVMVVVVILAILASLMVPRITGNARRKYDNTIDRLADLLVMYAQRDTLSRNPVGLAYDPATLTFTLTILATDSDDPDGRAEWQRDTFVNPVRLPSIVDESSVQIYADNEPVDASYWPLTHAPGDKRPEIVIALMSQGGEFRTRLVLPPHAVGPRRIDLDGRRVGGVRESDYANIRVPIDLDAAGRTREDW